MLRADNRYKFVNSQVPEITGLQDMKVFDCMSRSDLPAHANVINAIWSYRHKRRPDGSLLKYKARICVDSSSQHSGIDYWETYSPVVQ